MLKAKEAKINELVEELGSAQMLLTEAQGQLAKVRAPTTLPTNHARTHATQTAAVPVPVALVPINFGCG